MQRSRRWQDDPARAALLAVYEEADRAVSDFSCDASTECCRFGITGREPYVTAVELAEIRYAVAAIGAPKKRTLRTVRGDGQSEGRCPMLDDAGRCRIYRARPLGCRTFFCARAHGPGKLPRGELQRLAARLGELSARAFPGEPPSRPLTRAL
jgi:Fe-S-cluster containining protein